MIIILIILSLSLLIFAHEAGHFFVAKKMGMKVEEFGFGFPPRLFAWKRGETEYSVNALPFGGFVRIAGEHDRLLNGAESLEALPAEEKRRIFSFQSASRRSAVILAGVAVNFLLGWLLLSAVYAVGTPKQVFINAVEPESPAESVGLQAGDRIIGFSTTDEVIAFVGAHRGQEIALTIDRGGTEQTVRVTPRMPEQTDKGALGVMLTQGGVEKSGIFVALWDALRDSFAVFWGTIVGLFVLLKTIVLQGTLLQGVVGPVGIVATASQTGALGFMYFVQLLAVISLNLAAMNLIPFPALDGGRFLLIMLEKIKGSPVPRTTELWVNGVGFFALMALMVLITIRDIGAL